MTAEVCLTESCTPPFAVLGFNIDIFWSDWNINNDSASIERYLQTGGLLGTTCEVADLVQACNEAFGASNCMCVTKYIFIVALLLKIFCSIKGLSLLLCKIEVDWLLLANFCFSTTYDDALLLQLRNWSPPPPTMHNNYPWLVL